MSNSAIVVDNLAERFETLRNDASISLEVQLKEAEELSKQALNTGDLILECEILVFLGRGYRLLGDAFKSISSLNKAYIVVNSNFPHKNEILAEVYRELCNVYGNSLKDHITAIEYCFKGYKLNVTKLNSIFLNNLGSNYTSMAQHEEAIYYLQKGIPIAEENEDYINLAFLNHNLAENYVMTKDYDRAIQLFNISIGACEKLLQQELNLIDFHNCHYIYAYNQWALGNVYLKQNKLDLAKEKIELGKKISMKSRQDVPLSSLYILEGEVLLKENNYVEFKKRFEKSIAFCDQNGLFRDKDSWLKIKQKHHEENNEFEQAYFVTKQIIENTEAIKSKHKEFNISQLLVSKEEEILELEHKNRIMKIQKEELKQFAYIVTHDLKTPLSNISNFAGLFNRKFRNKIDAKGEEYLDYIIGSATNMSSMLSDLLQYISFDRTYDTKFEPSDIEASAMAILDKYKITADQFELNLNNINLIPIRQFHLEILLDNLVKNSIKFKREGIPLYLDIEVSKTEQEYTIKIHDNGIGIEDKYKTQIFEIFKRLNKNHSSGTGIGLSICKKIVQTYMGSIWVEDNKYGGSTFAFKISNNSEAMKSNFASNN